jgi:hypothetical protein
VDFLVGPLAVQATWAVDADAMAVLEVDDLAGRCSPGLVFGELVDDGGDPAVLLHRETVVRICTRVVDRTWVILGESLVDRTVDQPVLGGAR